MNNDSIIIYCDGACSGNQQRYNVGGWGVVLKRGSQITELYGGEINTTNNRMELTACIKALEAVKGAPKSVSVYSDSAYLVNCIQQGWYLKWRRNGWQTAGKQPVENQDLWKRLLELMEKLPVQFFKVKGHAGEELNERADALANRGMTDIKKNSDPPAKNELSDDPRFSCRKVEGGYLLRLARGVRVMETLHDFILAKKIPGGVISAIGALEQVELGYFDLSEKTYLRRAFKEIYELVSFNGNISYLDDRQPFVHAHAVLSDRQYRPIAGHFFEGTVAVTMEVYLQTFTNRLTRSFDAATELKLLNL